MERWIDQLVLYSPPADSVLRRMARMAALTENGQGHDLEAATLRRDVLRSLLDMGETYGLQGNLWHHALTFWLITSENPFSLAWERQQGGDASVRPFAMADLLQIHSLYHEALDWTADWMPDPAAALFDELLHYTPVPKPAQQQYARVARRVEELSRLLADAPDADALYALLTDHYRRFGVGMWGLYAAFGVRAGADGLPQFHPVVHTGNVALDDLIGYELQKQQLRQNVEAFLRGHGANNMLLYGDAGTGKSTSVKALIHEYSDDGLRLIEIYKHQFPLLADVIRQIKDRPYGFLIFMDDLSFEENEVEYKYLKAVIEGGVETKPSNVLICATSNRRHLIRETWKDRQDMEYSGDVHRSDTMEERLSLAARFGCQINFDVPDRKLYHAIVSGLIQRWGHLPLGEEELQRLANAWEIRHGGISGRTAQQFVTQLLGAHQSKEDGGKESC